MTLKNKDLEKKDELEIKNSMKEAIESGDSEAFVVAQTALAKSIEERVLEEAKDARNEDWHDQRVMEKRNLNPLTAEEREYYNEVIGGAGFAGTEKLMPATVFDRVFDNLRKNHPLLSRIDFKNTTGVTEWITRNGAVEAAWWGQLTDAIQKKLSAAFKKEDTDLYKLSAYMPVAKAMLDLGPEWLDRFVREVLYESVALALEMAIVDGTGDGEPIGMNRDLGGAVVDGVYPKKTAQPLTNLEPGTLGQKIMAPLTKDGERAVPQAIILVNPLDYWERIFAQTTFLTADKTYVYGVLPIPAEIIQSVAVTKGELIAGVARDYFMGIGSSQKIEYSDHYKFLEDERTYITKQYANGKPVDNESFLLFNISNMAPAVNTDLDSLSLGSLTLSPSFDPATTDYTASTTDASNNIKAVAESEDATIAIAVDGTSHENDTAYSWSAGENVVTITVTNESEAKVYTVTVTKS
ncbi:MAG: major capsid protein [Candidatus Frackibacter sp. T328-2]|nr:MAG: major capsid protein [Candidatus Frackibacter sp. T328-2]